MTVCTPALTEWGAEKMAYLERALCSSLTASGSPFSSPQLSAGFLHTPPPTPPLTEHFTCGWKGQSCAATTPKMPLPVQSNKAGLSSCNWLDLSFYTYLVFSNETGEWEVPTGESPASPNTSVDLNNRPVTLSHRAGMKEKAHFQRFSSFPPHTVSHFSPQPCDSRVPDQAPGDSDSFDLDEKVGVIVASSWTRPAVKVIPLHLWWFIMAVMQL